MKRCFEEEWSMQLFGKADHYYCGGGLTLSDGRRYCPDDGKLKGYVGYCAAINPPAGFDIKNQKED